MKTAPCNYHLFQSARTNAHRQNCHQHALDLRKVIKLLEAHKPVPPTDYVHALALMAIYS
jgi:hypothetical protein